MNDRDPMRVVEPGVEGPRWTLHSVHPITRSGLEAAIAGIAERGGGEVDLWIEAVETDDDAIATGAGFEAYRELWQLRCPLPAAPSGLEVRAFEPGDADAFLEVNNRAFAWHPEQGGMTHAELAGRQAEPWYDPAGFLIYESGDRMAGFCWTKIHADTDPPLGEIYVIAVDPDFHGQGLGGPMTLAGLQHLADRGLTTGMLYVESDNDPANAVYTKIGFTRHQANRVYTRVVGAK